MAGIERVRHGDGGGPETFTTVGGLKTASFNLNTGTVDATNMGSNGMRELLAGAGARASLSHVRRQLVGAATGDL